jgi:hypothetical protein
VHLVDAFLAVLAAVREDAQYSPPVTSQRIPTYAAHLATAVFAVHIDLRASFLLTNKLCILFPPSYIAGAVPNFLCIVFNDLRALGSLVVSKQNGSPGDVSLSEQCPETETEPLAAAPVQGAD